MAAAKSLQIMRRGAGAAVTSHLLLLHALIHAAITSAAGAAMAALTKHCEKGVIIFFDG
jgi:hypothetical protein